ncbi:hypothetical protein EB796_006138 [Bugula neritina]|uniref:Uncharacterized protein n=1 Tax=Bugula neritina TaxID=10212 RepID=A0A7J7KBG4_BUGNE|nr:hypothetical protein EB796_006138 [Bugula neritina]
MLSLASYVLACFVVMTFTIVFRYELQEERRVDGCFRKAEGILGEDETRCHRLSRSEGSCAKTSQHRRGIDLRFS